MTESHASLKTYSKLVQNLSSSLFFYEVLKEKHSLFYKLFAGDTDDMGKI